MRLLPRLTVETRDVKANALCKRNPFPVLLSPLSPTQLKPSAKRQTKMLNRLLTGTPAGAKGYLRERKNGKSHPWKINAFPRRLKVINL